MKKLLLLYWCFIAYGLLAQNQERTAYSFDGDYIVFRFDVRDYDYAVKDKSYTYKDFEDLNIKEVAVSGDFNNWSRKGWKMTKVSEYEFELRKKIDDFDDHLGYQFKYVINGAYWAEPDASFNDVVPARDIDSDHVYNIYLKTATISDSGNVTFRLNGFTRANKVILAGSFNQWNEHKYQMNRKGNGWELSVELEPGSYQYKFIVDGKWMHDPANPLNIRNEHNTLNSILLIGKEVVFTLESEPGMESVLVTGSFNNWSEEGIPLTRQGRLWRTTVPLSPGKHFYKFIVNGDWICDPHNDLTQGDGVGNLNSVVIVN